jgi:hypothetical protein
MSWHARLILLRPTAVKDHLDRLVVAGVIDDPPTLWQVELGVLRMWHRVVFRSDTVGTCAAHAPRSGWRARLLHARPIRLPFLIAERAIAPLDHSGLAQPAWRMVRHLLAAHHDHHQAAYDLEILRGNPPALDEVIAQCEAIVAGRHPRGAWLRDLVVFDQYHETLLEQATSARAGRIVLDEAERDDPDISFGAWIRWCRAQPASPAETIAAWRAGAFPRVAAAG